MTKKTGLQKSVQGILAWTLVPIVIGAIIGIFTQPLITPIVGAVVLLSLSALTAAILAMRRGDMTGVGGWWMVWLGTFALLGYLLVPKDWVWWIGVVIGVVIALVITGVWFFFGRRLFDRQSAPTQVTPAHAPTVTRTVREEAQIDLGLRTAKGTAMIDAGRTVASLGRQVDADLAHAQAMMRQAEASGDQTKLERAKLLQKLIDDGKILEALKPQAQALVCKLCGVETPTEPLPASKPTEKRRYDPKASSGKFRPR